MKVASLCWIGILSLVNALADHSEHPERLASIRVDMQMVSVTPAAALGLVPALSDESMVEQAFAQLQELIARDEATLLACPVLWLQNGVRAVAESVEEL